jgi:hypothetical protein
MDIAHIGARKLYYMYEWMAEENRYLEVVRKSKMDGMEVGGCKLKAKAQEGRRRGAVRPCNRGTEWLLDWFCGGG